MSVGFSAVAVTLTVVFVVAVTATRQQDSFYFDPAPVSQDVVERSPVRLRCDVSNRQQIRFYWTLNGKPVVNSSRRWQDGSDLRISGVDRALDAGSLRCIATNVTTGIALRSAAARLHVLCKQYLCTISHHHHHRRRRRHRHFVVGLHGLIRGIFLQMLTGQFADKPASEVADWSTRGLVSNITFPFIRIRKPFT